MELVNIDESKSIPLSSLQLAVAQALSSENKQRFSHIGSFLQEFINSTQQPAVSWKELKDFIDQPNALTGLGKELQLSCFSYEVLKYSGLEVLIPLIPDEILYALQDRYKEAIAGDKMSLTRCFEHFTMVATTWGTNPYITALSGCSFYSDYAKVAKYRDEIQTLDPELKLTGDYCDLLIKRGFIDIYRKESLMGTNITLTDLPSEVIRTNLVSKFFNNDIRRLKSTCTQMRNYLIDIDHLPPILIFELGKSHSACVKSNGRVYAWGFNKYGQLGNGDNKNKLAPVQVIGLPEGIPVRQLCLGDTHSGCVLMDGRAFVWGDNRFGQLGIGSTINQPRPVQVPIDGPVKKLYLGKNFSACITEDERVFVWGSNEYGKLGIGSTENQSKPVQVLFPIEGRFPIKSLCLCDTHIACLSEDGQVFMWGYNRFGQLGIGDTSDQSKPVKVLFPVEVPVMQLYSANNHSASILSNGQIFTWCENNTGKLGNRNKPAQVVGLPEGVLIKQLCLGFSHSGCLLANGDVYVWGANQYGQLGIGNRTGQTKAVKVPLDGPARKLYLSGDSSACMMEDSRVFVWGLNSMLGIGGNSQLTPAPFVLQDGVGVPVKLYLGCSNKACVLENGQFFAWGLNDFGQLGIGNRISQSRPVQILGLEEVPGRNETLTSNQKQ